MGKTLIINPGQCTSLHYHEKKHETMYVMRGSVDIHFPTSGMPQSIQHLHAGEYVEILPMTKHRIFAGELGLTLIEASTPHPDDSVRVKE